MERPSAFIVEGAQFCEGAHTVFLSIFGGVVSTFGQRPHPRSFHPGFVGPDFERLLCAAKSGATDVSGFRQFADLFSCPFTRLE